MFKFQEFDRVDHIAIAVVDLKESIRYYSDQLGFELDCVRDTFGKFSGMRSAVLFSGDFSVVLLQSLDEESQIQKYLDKYGAGVQHVAFRVSEIENVESLLQERGVEFSTSIIEGPGLRQIFTKRDPASGMMFEFIERVKNDNYSEESINNLFAQLEDGCEY